MRLRDRRWDDGSATPETGVLELPRSAAEPSDPDGDAVTFVIEPINPFAANSVAGAAPPTRIPGHDLNPRRKRRSSELAFKGATADEGAISPANEMRMAGDLSPRAAWPMLCPSAAATVPDIEFALSAGVSLSAILFKLVADAAEALDYDHEAARALLRRAATLLQSGAARRGRTARAPTEVALAPWKAGRVASHIEDNLDRSLPVAELARVAGLSDSYFWRAFKGAFGQTPHAFIICRRVERARKEMLKAQEPLSQIALSCGFADQAHLARIFRRATGLAPSEWRRANRLAVDRLHCDASALHQGHGPGLSPLTCRQNSNATTTTVAPMNAQGPNSHAAAAAAK
jgi:AraC family transcriptional regulator